MHIISGFQLYLITLTITLSILLSAVTTVISHSFVLEANQATLAPESLCTTRHKADILLLLLNEGDYSGIKSKDY